MQSVCFPNLSGTKLTFIIKYYQGKTVLHSYKQIISYNLISKFLLCSFQESISIWFKQNKKDFLTVSRYQYKGHI